MVQMSELSPLAQASWAVSCASENKWLCNHQSQSQRWMSNLKPQEHRNAILSRETLRFEELQDAPQLLCHMGISGRRGQGVPGKFNPIPYNDAALPQCPSAGK